MCNGYIATDYEIFLSLRAGKFIAKRVGVVFGVMLSI